MTEERKQLGRLERIDLRLAWASETGDFTPWLAKDENISLLGEAIGIELEVEAQEKSVGPFRADILCKDLTTSSWVLIENQLERTDHCHLGQLITYAAGLDAVTIVWVSSRFTEEHRAALDWLNEVTNDGLLFFGLEVELWRIGNSPMAPKINIVCSPNDWSKSVSGAQKAIEQGTLTESGKRYVDFWTYFGKEIENRKSSLRVPKPNADYWKTFSLGRSEFTVTAIAQSRDGWIGIQVTLYGPQAKTGFRLLEQMKSEIESAIGATLDWRELPARKESQIRLIREGADVKQQETWPEICDWLIHWTEKFQAVFRPIVKDLDLTIEAPVYDPLSVNAAN